MVIHVLDLPFDVAVDALAVGPVGQLAHHAQPVGPLLLGKELPDGDGDALAPLLGAHAHHLLPQAHLGLRHAPVLLLPPASLQGAEIKSRTAIETWPAVVFGGSRAFCLSHPLQGGQQLVADKVP